MIPREVLDRRSDGTMHVTVPAGSCTPCDTTLAVSGGHSAGGRRSTKSVAGCEEHLRTVHLTGPDGDTATLRAPREQHSEYDHVLINLSARVLQQKKTWGAADIDALLPVLRAPRDWLVTASDVQSAQEQMARALWWSVTQNDPETMRRAVAAGVNSPDAAAQWVANGVMLEDVPRWVAKGITRPFDANEWKTYGLDADQVPPGFTRVDDYEFVEQINHPGHHDPGFVVLRDRANPYFVNFGWELSCTIEEIGALADALSVSVEPEHVWDRAALVTLGNRTLRAAWSEKRCDEFVAAAAALCLVDWTDAATCLRAGMTVEATAEHLTSGGDMEPVRLLVALA